MLSNFFLDAGDSRGSQFVLDCCGFDRVLRTVLFTTRFQAFRRFELKGKHDAQACYLRVIMASTMRYPSHDPSHDPSTSHAHVDPRAAPHAVHFAGLVPRVQHRVDARFWAILDRALGDGVEARHCGGSRCDPMAAACACPCAACDRRRTMHERAWVEVALPAMDARDAPAASSGEVGAAACGRGSAALVASVERRWHALQLEAYAAREPAFHCEDGACGGEDAIVCGCACDGCSGALDLLVLAEQQVLGGE